MMASPLPLFSRRVFDRMIRFSILISVLLLGSTSAFVAPLSQSSRCSIMQSTTPIHLLDPSHVFESATSLLADASLAPPEQGGVSYSRASYYTILGLYLISFPGLWSTIKRSTTAKVKRKTFVAKGENDAEGMSLRQQAGEIMACTWACFAVDSSWVQHAERFGVAIGNSHLPRQT